MRQESTSPLERLYSEFPSSALTVMYGPHEEARRELLYQSLSLFESAGRSFSFQKDVRASSGRACLEQAADFGSEGVFLQEPEGTPQEWDQLSCITDPALQYGLTVVVSLPESEFVKSRVWQRLSSLVLRVQIPPDATDLVRCEVQKCRTGQVEDLELTRTHERWSEGTRKLK